MELRRAEWPRQPPGPSPARAGRRPGSAGRPGRGAFAGNDRRPAGHPESGRRLRAAGPGLSGRAPALPDGRQWHRPAAQPVLAAGQPAAARGPAAAGPGPRAAGTPAGGQPGEPQPPGEPGVPHLHLRFHRPAERRQRRPGAAGHALPGHRRAVRHDPGRPRAAVRLHQLRRRPRALADPAGLRFRADAAGQRAVERGAHLRRDRTPPHHHRLLHPQLPAADGRLHR
ncbi:hypothetical protein D3C80_670620 [compost metagenome]